MGYFGAIKKTGMDKQLNFRSAPLSYQLNGNGYPIMLVHGFGEDRSIWQQQVQALASQALVITPDLPGSGASPWPCSGDGFLTMEDYAASLKAILDAENLERCTIVGHSMGGYIALAFAAQWPERMDGLGLFHSTAAADGPEKIAARERGIAFVRQHGAAAFLAEVLPNLYGENFKQTHASQVAEHILQANQFTDAAIIGYYQAMLARPDRKTVLQNFAKPVLFIMGEDDKTVHLQETLPQSHLPVECHVHIWKNVAHMGMRENPSQANAALQEFLSHVNEN